jgi:HEAT repeat protein
METETEVTLKKHLNSPDPRERRDAITRLADYKIVNASGLLMKQLSYKDASVRSAAAAALGKLGDKRAARQLIKLLSSPNEDLTVRSAAATALGDLGEGLALEPLIKMLNEEQSSLRQVAAIALGKLGQVKAAEPLIHAMREDDSFVREAAATGLSMLGDDLSKIVSPLRDLKSFDSGQRKDAVTELSKSQNPWVCNVIEEILLTDVDHTVRKVAAESLKTTGEKHSVKYLMKALGDPHKEVRKAAAEALQSLGEEAGTIFINTLNGDEQALEVLVSKYSNQLIAPLIFVQRDTSDSTIQENARKAIKKIGKLAISPLTDLLRIQDEFVRTAVITAFVDIGKESIAPLSNVIKRSRDFSERINAAIVLGKLKDPIVVTTLLRMLNSPSPREREEACIALGEIGDKQAVEYLIKVVESDSELPNVKREAAKALGRFKDETRAIEPLLKSLNDSDAAVREAAEEAIKGFGESAAEFLIPKLSVTEDSSLRKKIIDLLGRFKANQAVEALIAALKDEEAHLRIAAVHALGEIGDSRALEPLLEMLNSLEREEENVRETLRPKIQDSLAKIGIANVPALIKMIEDQPPQVRIDTISALGNLGDSRAVDSLINIVKADENIIVRQAAAEALGMIGDPKALTPLEQIQKEEVNFMAKFFSRSMVRNLSSLKKIAELAKEKIRENKQEDQNTELNQYIND